ncbi:MAG: ATP-grasp domain-containing protein [Fermentimonas sp.]|nr:ATP-grasp domain-containing protein [Fermentimonas sp.]
MNDSFIIVVGAGLLMVPTIKTARQMGLKVIAFDRDKSAPGFKYADVQVIVSTKDVEGCIKEAKTVSQIYNVVGVFTAGADVEVTVASVAKTLGLPGIDPRVAYICNNKTEMRRVLEAHGIPGPKFTEVNSLTEAKSQIKTWDYPLIAKAVDNCGSRGVIKVITPEDLDKVFFLAQKYSSNGKVLIEEYLEGSKQTVEMLVYDDKFYLCSIIDTHYGYEPYTVETYHNNPSRLCLEDQKLLFSYAEKVARAVGINMGAAKVDTILTSNGPMVIELTARLSGGFHCQYTSRLAYGTNDIKAAIDIALGNELDVSDITHKYERAAICQAIFPAPGEVINISGIKEAKEIEGIHEIFILVEKGDIITPYQSSADRVCFIIADGDNMEETEERIKRAVSLIRIETV